MSSSKTALRVIDLRVDAVYLSPLGRLCKLVPASARGIGSSGDQFEFKYASGAGDGFWLRESNIRLMQLVAQ